MNNTIGAAIGVMGAVVCGFGISRLQKNRKYKEIAEKLYVEDDNKDGIRRVMELKIRCFLEGSVQLLKRTS